MVGGCLSCFLTYMSVLLLGVCLQDVETSRCELNIYKKVGDTVELSSCSANEEITLAEWKYQSSTILDNKNTSFKSQFMGRLELHPTSFNLTVRRLTLKDSGDFSFISEMNDAQRPTVIISLHIYEPITIKPTVTSNSSWNASNNSCRVYLLCSATAGSIGNYSWDVRNETFWGSRLPYYIITPQDGDIGFTCTISNFVSEKSASVTVKCSSDPQESGPKFVVLLCAAGGGCLTIVVIVGVAIHVCHRKKGQAGSDSNDHTVYADITDVAIRGDTSSTMKPYTLYDTIENRVDTVPLRTQTVYDEIKFSRMRKASVSPHQEIS